MWRHQGSRLERARNVCDARPQCSPTLAALAVACRPERRHGGANYLFHESKNSDILSFMKTIVIANQKGGSGKSTLAVHLAAAAEHAGDGPIIITDTDPQGTAGDWFNQRKRSGIDMPLYAPLALSDLATNLDALDDAGAAYLFIDTAPSVGAVNAELFAAADLILIPLNPTPADLRALVKGQGYSALAMPSGACWKCCSSSRARVASTPE